MQTEIEKVADDEYGPFDSRGCGHFRDNVHVCKGQRGTINIVSIHYCMLTSLFSFLRVIDCIVCKYLTMYYFYSFYFFSYHDLSFFISTQRENSIVKLSSDGIGEHYNNCVESQTL